MSARFSEVCLYTTSQTSNHPVINNDIWYNFEFTEISAAGQDQGTFSALQLHILKFRKELYLQVFKSKTC